MVALKVKTGVRVVIRCPNCTEDQKGRALNEAFFSACFLGAATLHLFNNNLLETNDKTDFVQKAYHSTSFVSSINKGSGQ